MAFKVRIFLLGLILVLSPGLSGCSSLLTLNLITPTPLLLVTSAPSATTSPTPFLPMTNTPFLLPPTYTPTSTFTPTATDTPLPTDTPVPTDTPLPTPTSVVIIDPGTSIIAPILLYHHI